MIQEQSRVWLVIILVRLALEGPLVLVPAVIQLRIEYSPLILVLVRESTMTMDLHLNVFLAAIDALPAQLQAPVSHAIPH